MEALNRAVEPLETDPLCIFADIGGEGSGGHADPSIITILRGPRLIRQIELMGRDTTQLSDAIADVTNTELANLPADAQFAVGVDVIGIGRGVFDQLVNVQRLRNVYRLDVSTEALNPQEYHRMRDQVWWELREGFMSTKEISLPMPDGHLVKKDDLDELIGELTSIKWAEVVTGHSGKIKVQGKGNSSGIPGVKPLARSPNRGDSLCGAWWLYKHAVSRIPPKHQRQRRVRQRPANWKAL
jgi:hypothetical protein